MTAEDVNVPLSYCPTAVSGFYCCIVSSGFEHYAAIRPKSNMTDVADIIIDNINNNLSWAAANQRET